MSELAPGPVSVTPMASAEDARAFKVLNEQWITEMFTIEPRDRAVLDDPAGAIVARGGEVLIARLEGEIVGCAAVIAAADGVFELSKMAVLSSVRGRGVGRVLLLEAIASARAAGATKLYLGSSTKLESAVHLYESVGFRHVTAAEIGPMPYERCDVYMSYDLH